MSDLVEFERLGPRGEIGVARLVREKPLNSLLLQTINELSAQILPWLEDEAIACILLDSSSARAFCAGADITALHDAIRSGDLATPDAFFCNEYRLDYALHTAEKPIVVWGNGIVMGGGLGLLGGCSHRVGTPATRIAMPEITIGLFPDAGGTWLLSNLPDDLGYFAGLTGCQLTAADSLALGLLDHVVDAESKQAIFDDLAAMDWAHEPKADKAQVTGLLDAFRWQGELPRQLLRHRELVSQLVRECLAADSFLAAFEPQLATLDQDEWLQAAAETYHAGSPTTAAIFIEQMKRAEGMSLADTFRLELTIACQCARHDDFPEGVRALLVDKDRNPRWRYSDHRDMPDAYLASFFEPAWQGPHPLADLE